MLLGRKAMTNLDSILKSRDITWLTKVYLVEALVFPVVRYGCDSWTVKKAEHWKTDAFELWCWRRLLRAPWTARRSNQSILKEIRPECSLEGRMLTLKLWYFGSVLFTTMWRTDSLEKILMLGKIEAGGDGEIGPKMVGWHHRLNGCEFEQALGVDDGQGSLMCCSLWGPKELDMTELWLSYWTEELFVWRILTDWLLNMENICFSLLSDLFIVCET